MTEAHTVYRLLAESNGIVPGITAAGPDRDPQERDRAIEEELPQVYFIAARIHERLPASVQLEDLVSAGVVGLLEAWNNFDPHKNAQFKTFARFRIRGAILDSLRTLDWGSRSQRRRAREIAEATQRLEGTLGRKPAKEEIAAELGLTLAQLESALTEIDGLQIVGQQTSSMMEDGEVHDWIESAPSLEENPFDLCLRGEQKRHLAEAIGALNPREQLLLSLYYKEELTMKEVAQVMDIALSRVSQIHHAVLGKLRAALARMETRPTQPETFFPTAGGRWA